MSGGQSRDARGHASATGGPVWLSRLIGRREDPPQPASGDQPDDLIQVLRPAGPWWIGLLDQIRSGWFNKETGELVPGVPVGPNDIVLDLGCGEGNLLEFCANQGSMVIGVENHSPTLEAARKRLETAGDRVTLALATDGSPIPVADDSATVVLCTEVLEHVADPEETVRELIRVGKPNATFVFSVPAAESEALASRQAPTDYFRAPNHIRVFDQAALVGLLEAQGLRVQSVTRLGFFWSVWFTLMWHTGVDPADGRHPLLDLWTATWCELLESPGGAEAKRSLDDALPKTLLVVAQLTTPP